MRTLFGRVLHPFVELIDLGMQEPIQRLQLIAPMSARALGVATTQAPPGRLDSTE